MITAEQELGLIRPQIVRSVARLRKDGLSQMDAYEALGREIGKSSRWVRKVIGRDATAAVYLRDALNIRAAYERLCARVEAMADAIEAGNDELRRELDAALGSDRAGAARVRQSPRHAEAPPRCERPAPATAPLPPPAAPLHVGAHAPRDLTDLPLFRAADDPRL